MKLLAKAAATALVLGQIATPVSAAEIPGERGPSATRMDAFAGARLRLPLGGSARAAKPRLGLTLAPTRRSIEAAGATRLRFGEGLELSLAGSQKPEVRVAGRRVAPDGRLVDENGRRLGIGTIGAVAIGAGVVLVGALFIALAIRSDED